MDDNYGSQCISFGNLNITVHSAGNSVDVDSIKSSIIKTTKTPKCKIDVSDSEEDYELEIEANKTKSVKRCEKIKTLKIYSDIFSNGSEILRTNLRCMHCHHQFTNKPFFLPYAYNDQLKRYKVTGNFCTPNCVKAYALGTQEFKNKVHIVGQMYRELFSSNFRIRPSPPINMLKCYGGKLTIDEYRSLLYKNKEYLLHNINCKISTLDVSEQRLGI